MLKVMYKDAYSRVKGIPAKYDLAGTITAV
jgi:hypothetical protein